MPQHATDFYVQDTDTKDLTYLGTAKFANHPVGMIPLQAKQVGYSRSDFRFWADKWIDTKQWPHRHSDSSDTKWTVVFRNGTVTVYEYGRQVAMLYPNGSRTVRNFPRTATR